MIPLNRPALGFREQRDALAQAATEVPQGTTLGQSFQAANSLFSQAQQFAQGTPLDGMTREDAQKLMGVLDAGPRPMAPLDKNSLSFGSNNPRANGGAAMNMGEREQKLYDLMIDRGFTPIQAQGSLMNFKDESGLRADIVEGAPNVHGTRGQGLYQLTDSKPGVGRRTDYLNYMKSNGKDDVWSDESQIDFYRWEIENTEKGNWQKFANAATPGEFAAGMVGDFLRPAAEHRQARQAKYLASDKWVK